MADIEHLPQEKIHVMRQKFNARVDKKFKSLITPDMDSHKIKTIRQYLTVHFLNAEQRPDQSLKYLVERGADFIKDVSRRQALPFFSAEQRLEIKDAARFRYKEEQTGLLNTPYRRLYFPLIPPTGISATQIKIENFLNNNDYILHDYKSGYAKKVGDDKQILKIGKIIKTDHHLLKAFRKDFTRFAHKQFLVLSSYANDIAHMSTRRGWETCMSHDGDYIDKMPEDIKHGTLVAYLINEDDPNIYNPLARILLKALYNKNGSGHAIYVPAKTYGLYHTPFQETANQVAQQLSTKEYGSFKLVGSVYPDSCIKQKTNLPTDLHNTPTEEILKILTHDYTKEKDGSFTVHGDLDLSKLSLGSLPDLRNVKVEGSFSCASNNLTSLVGCPEHIEGHLKCNNNALINLNHAPKHLGQSLFCSDNNLESLIGAPEHINGNFFCSYNNLIDLTHAPKHIEGCFYCDHNQLHSLSGAPEYVGGEFNCSNNKIMSLEHSPNVAIGGFNCTDNFLNTLEGISSRVNKVISCWNNPIKTLEHAPKYFSNLVCDTGTFYGYADIMKYIETSKLSSKNNSLTR